MRSEIETTSTWNRRLRAKWERIWRDGSVGPWTLVDPPAELVELVERGRYVPGAALDLGSGDGSVTGYLAGFFRPAVGIDIAFEAASAARERSSGRAAHYVVADVEGVPLRSQAFTLIFDRGCLQALPESSWPAYFDEIERLLAPGGVLVLYQEIGAMRRTRARAGGGTRARRSFDTLMWKATNVRRASSRIEEGVPSFLERLDSRIVPFTGVAGIRLTFVYALYRKTTQRKNEEAR